MNNTERERKKDSEGVKPGDQIVIASAVKYIKTTQKYVLFVTFRGRTQREETEDEDRKNIKTFPK